MRDIFEIIRERHSSRMPFDRERSVPEQDLHRILESARWAPTAHNMQNFEIVVVDDETELTAIAAVSSEISETFIRENCQQLSASQDELLRKKTGLLATMFPASWRTPETQSAVTADTRHRSLEASMQGCPVLLIVVYDTRKRAPASEGDFLGIMSLGCVMQNIWLTAEALGIGMQILSAFSGQQADEDLRRILKLPGHNKIAFACRIGYPAARPGGYPRVRRDLGEFVHRYWYGRRIPSSPSR